MKLEEKEILRKKRILEYAEACGNVLKTCRHFGVSRSNLYIWRAAYRSQGVNLTRLPDSFGYSFSRRAS